LEGEFRGRAEMNIWRIPYPKFGAGPGLERVAAIAARLDLDLAAFAANAAVIVGSNGKGSTAAMTAAILQQTGADVGLFTSPHLFALNERFRIGDDDMSDDKLGRHWARVTHAVEAAGVASQIGGFEFLFLIAADWFAASGCTHTIWEAGIGGRLDPVRLIEARRLALTSLDLEHTDLLGDTLEDIARDKLDAAPTGATVYLASSCMPQIEAIKAHCGARQVTAKLTLPLPPGDGPPSLAGAHQRENAALAAALARDIADANDDQIARGLAATRWPGRLEVLAVEPLIVIDVGHTPSAIRAARAGFDAMRGARSGVLVCGVSHDKNIAELVESLAPGFACVICAAAEHKGAPAAEIARYAAAANPEAEIVLAESVADAHALAIAKARALDAVVYVAGGLFLAAEFKAVRLGRNPDALVFF
jgi:dihydrofolate synthase / folylpolyglutamate synthase